MPSVAADFDLNCPLVRARLHAGALLAARGVYGIVWLDDDLIVRSRYGSITDFINEGVPLSDSVLPVVGLEEEIKALRSTKDQMLRLPNVSTVTEAGPSPRLTLLFYAFEEAIPFIMIVAAAAAHTNLEIELSRQVRARLMAEAEAAAKSKELARANADLKVLNTNLEQFAAIVTHDLKSPMRAVGYLVDEIETAVGVSDTETARGKLNELRRQSTRLSSMLSALLHYSSTGLSQQSIQTVDTLALVTEVVRSLPHQGIEIDIRGNWPTLDTLQAPLDLALRNLIDNTVKHHDRGTGILRLACSDAGSAIEITVEDDGPGIDPAHHAAVFLPFRTVSNGGDGMGLAIVQKMIDAAGGVITLSSNPAVRRGTTFRIRWPKQIAL
jgi:signal transduction histidine kinase